LQSAEKLKMKWYLMGMLSASITKAESHNGYQARWSWNKS